MTRSRSFVASLVLGLALSTAALPAAGATVRDVVYTDAVAAGPYLSPDLAIDISTRTERLSLTATGAVAGRLVAAPRGTAVFPTAAHAAGVLSVRDGRLIRTGTSSATVRQTWVSRYAFLDADYSSAGTMVALIRGQAATVALVRGSLSSTTIRTVRGWTLDRGLTASVVLSRDGRYAYVALPSATGTSVLRVTVSTGAVRTIAWLAGVTTAGIDLSPSGTYLALAARRPTAPGRVLQPLAFIPASGGRGSWHLDVPASQRPGQAGDGPEALAYSADGSRLLLSYGYSVSLVGFDSLDVVPGALMRVAVRPGAAISQTVASGLAGDGVAVLRT
ncbi:MAG TPA: hypothetical protein VFL59_11270 [Candidatus Nanopelagicales bacterium]|nr:hypothetical protein [Candidatus Nanopelagicales bacterium]